jgi:hypothetical protein
MFTTVLDMAKADAGDARRRAKMRTAKNLIARTITGGERLTTGNPPSQSFGVPRGYGVTGPPSLKLLRNNREQAA